MPVALRGRLFCIEGRRVKYGPPRHVFPLFVARTLCGGDGEAPVPGNRPMQPSIRVVSAWPSCHAGWPVFIVAGCATTGASPPRCTRCARRGPRIANRASAGSPRSWWSATAAGHAGRTGAGTCAARTDAAGGRGRFRPPSTPAWRRHAHVLLRTGYRPLRYAPDAASLYARCRCLPRICASGR